MAHTKEWTVLVSVVAKPYERIIDPRHERHYMNTKADEVRTALEKAAGKVDIYVAYNIIYDPADPDPRYAEPVAQILNADPADGRLMTQTGWFGAIDAAGHLNAGEAISDNLLGFYAWALPRCPARHYAVFFWGHSFGPAGLFEAGTAPVLPNVPLEKLGPQSVAQTRIVLRKARVALGTGERRVTEEEITKADPDSDVFDPSTRKKVRVDVVLFQDCFMGTLETAFQLKDAAQFVVASQSYVPFGYPSVPTCGLPADRGLGRGVWPYALLFEKLLGYSSGGAGLNELITVLARYYDKDDASEIWPNASLPFALLDLDQIDDETINSLKTLIRALKRLKPTEKERGTFIELASLAVAGPPACLTGSPGPELAAGGIALVDVIRLCLQLCEEDLERGERLHIEKLRDMKLVVAFHESVNSKLAVFNPESGRAPGKPLSAVGLGFQGVSVFYDPTRPRKTKWGDQDTNVFPEVEAGFQTYRKLLLSQKVGIPLWTDFVLEQK